MPRYITQFRAHCKDCGTSVAYFSKRNRDDWAYNAFQNNRSRR
jgi:hypothetical protein